MVEFHGNDKASSTPDLKTQDGGALHVGLIAAMKEGMSHGFGLGFKDPGLLDGKNHGLDGLKGTAGDLSEGLKNSKDLPADSKKFLTGNFHNLDKTVLKDFPNVSIDIFGDKNRQQGIDKAADLIDETNTLGTDDQKKQLTKMFESEYQRSSEAAKMLGADPAACEKAGEEAVRKMVTDINKELEERGSESRISLERSSPEFDPEKRRMPGAPEQIGSVVVRRDGDQTDHIVLHEPESPLDRLKRNLLTDYKGHELSKWKMEQ